MAGQRAAAMSVAVRGIALIAILSEMGCLAQNCPPRPTSCPLQAQQQWVPSSDGDLFTSVCMHGNTEPNEARCDGVPHGVGNFTCQCCGQTLFSSDAMCHSGTNWPSFTTTLGACIVPGSTEVVCGRCGAHLGDFFHAAGWASDATCYLNDGTPQRFCVDGICLRPPPGTQYGEQCSPPAQACQYGQAVYFGDGCFWHTQYDMYLVELGATFNRSVDQITARTGYVGGVGTGPAGQVCYHGGPAGTMYGDMHYAEAVQLSLDPEATRAKCQFEALANKYFTESFQMLNGVVMRGDPGDGGPDYRNVIGVPGGVRGAFYPIIVANNVRNMSLVEGGVNGAGADTIDEGTVYIYDSDLFPFYRAEQYHQFHANVVLQRWVPDSYLVTAKAGSVARNWINPDCGESGAPNPAVTNVNNETTRCPMLASTPGCSATHPEPPPISSMSTSQTVTGSQVAAAMSSTAQTRVNGNNSPSSHSGTGVAVGLTVTIIVGAVAVGAFLLIKKQRAFKAGKAYVTLDSFPMQTQDGDDDVEMLGPQSNGLEEFD